MLVLQRAKTRRSGHRVGLAVAGGGPIGGMYELGALRALDVAIEGLDLTALDVYVGVSSGAFLAAGLANGMDTAQMCRIFLTDAPGDVRFRPEAFVRPAFHEYLRRATALPGLLAGWWRDLLLHPGELRPTHLLARFGGLVPTGLFDNSGVERFLRDAFSRRGRSNDFRTLRRRLYVIAVDLDSGDAVRFGAEGWDDVPISRAIQASAALPGLYPPVEIRGRHLVDGALRRTMHASVALDQGVDLLLGVNPLVPYDAGDANARIAAGGLPVVLSQTLRTVLQSRMQVGLAKYAQQYPNADQLVLEPDPDDAEMFFTNVFSYSARRRVCDHAYRATLRDLAAHADALAPALRRNGLALREDVLRDPPSLLDGLRTAAAPGTDTTGRLERTLDELESSLRHRRSRATPKSPSRKRAR